MEQAKKKTLVVITGPTGVGKTGVAIDVARWLGCEIINADSRQVFRGIPIGTAAPTAEQQAAVRHHFVAVKNLDEYYSASEFESDVLRLLETEMWQRGDYAVMCGGSMLYVDAVCNGIDELPTISDAVRAAVALKWRDEGLESLLAELAERDPAYYSQVDKRNAKRVAHAVEICRQAGRPYSELRTGAVKERDFAVVKVGLNVPREELFSRINARVDAMMAAGLEEEARRVYGLRQLNSLNTVGYKEMFAYFDGAMDLATARERIKKNTRVYAKKQLTWYAKDTAIVWCEPERAQEVITGLIQRAP